MAILGSRILVAYDESEHGRKALDTAARIAGQDPDVALHIVHVLEPVNVTGFGPEIGEWLRVRRENAEKRMEELRQSLQGITNPVTVHVVDGSPGERIVHTAAEQQCDLIVMGSRGLTGIKEFFLGSVSHYVAQRSACPVLIVK
jgi:nucleotide-binding universal stress UspA family protein